MKLDISHPDCSGRADHRVAMDESSNHRRDPPEMAMPWDKAPMESFFRASIMFAEVLLCCRRLCRRISLWTSPQHA